ncbi:lipoyl synthase [Haloplanus ruber]|uniref:lipoyl synthase n=1 Tax=Haloplanus ruber TaxID=869892 RepID=UPI0031B86329
MRPAERRAKGGFWARNPRRWRPAGRSSARDSRTTGIDVSVTGTPVESPHVFARRAKEAHMARRRKPDWLKQRPPSGQRFTEIKETLRDRDLHTVCEEANCPNLGECWSGRNGPGTATFMLMGDRCSRACNFCDVETGGMEALDPEEPSKVADAVAEIGLDYVVLTSVDRDDLPDQGAGHFARTVEAIKERDPGILVEVLIPDFRGDPALVDRIVEAGPDVIAHNVETVERLQWPVRDRRAGYEQSLSVLERVADTADVYTKTSLMLGVGEYDHEIYRTLSDCREAGVDVVTLGQYLQPSRSHLDVYEYVHPDAFETWRRVAEAELGFLYCASGPMVRSSYRAGELFVDAVLRDGRSIDEARREAHAAT